MTNATQQTNNINVGDIVRGKRCGMFVVLAFRSVGGEAHVQVKEVNPKTMALGRGEFALPVSAVVSA